MRLQQFGALLIITQIIIVGLTLGLAALAQKPVTLPVPAQEPVAVELPTGVIELPAGMTELPPETEGFFARAENVIGDVWAEIARPPLAWFDWLTLAAGAVIILIGRFKLWRERAGVEFNSDRLRPFTQFALCLLSLLAPVYLVYFLGYTDEFSINGSINFLEPDLPVSVGINLAEGFLDFSLLVLALLGFLLSSGIRLAAPIIIALALNRKIPGKSFLRHGWGICASFFGWPIFSVLLGMLGVLSREAARRVYDVKPGGEAIAITAMVATGLLVLATPWMSYRFIVGRFYESLLKIVETWRFAFRRESTL
jgi:hypothetical protein